MLRMIFRSGILLVLLAFAGTQAWARPVSDIQKRELVQLVNDMNKAAQRKDASLMVNSMPARLYKEMALRMHTSEMQLRNSFKQAVKAQFARLSNSGYTLDASAIHYGETKDGTFYALVPTRVETGDSISAFMTLALYDNTKWHLIYGGQKTIQNPVFLEIYPAFAGVAMPVPDVSRK